MLTPRRRIAVAARAVHRLWAACWMFVAPFAAAASQAPGTWEGSARSDTLRIDLRLELAYELDAAGARDSVSGSATLGHRRGLAARGAWTRSGDVRLQLAGDSTSAWLSARVADGVLEGTLHEGPRTEDVALVHVASLDSADVTRCEGAYELGRGHLVTLTRTVLGLSYVDFKTGETRTLTPWSSTSFGAAPTLLGRVPVELRFELRTDARGRATGLLIRHATGLAEYARKVRFRHEEVTFRDGDVVLSGTLVLPNGAGPYPALVGAPGSGPATRETPTAEWLAHNGIAFLGYDKRGAGHSTGQWRGASMDDLARDAVASVKLLRSRSDIDSGRIGVSGGSEGSWVAPLAAALSPDVGFIVVGAFSGHTLGEDIVWRITTQLELDGRFSAEQIRAATALRRRYNDAMLSGTGWDSLRVAIERSRDRPWFVFARVPSALPQVADSVDLARERRFLAFDPDTAWSRVRVPALLLASGRDRSAASLETWPRIERALRRAGNTAYKLEVFPTANHDGLESTTGADDEYPSLHRYAPGYLSKTLDWLRSTLHVVPPGP